MKYHLVKISLASDFDYFSFIGVDNDKAFIDAALPAGSELSIAIRERFYKDGPYSEFEFIIS